jgi:hypothetical protein
VFVVETRRHEYTNRKTVHHRPFTEKQGNYLSVSKEAEIIRNTKHDPMKAAAQEECV